MGNTQSEPESPSKFVECWRYMPWEDRKTLKEDLSKYSTGKESVPVANIAMFGLVAAGKSSFFNTIDSIFKERIAARGEAGGATHSVTKEFRMYHPGTAQQNLKFRLCDTMGMEEDQGLEVEDMPYILDGNIGDKFQFPVGSRITRDSPGFNRHPTVADRMHCICYVVDAKNVFLKSEDTVTKIKKLKSLARHRKIQFIILLTKIDELCSEVDKDVAKAYESYAMNEVVKEVSKVSGTPKNFIYLIKNYCGEIDLNSKVDILALRALKQILGYVDDILQDVDDD